MRAELTTAQLASEHGVHQTMVSEWKRQAMDGMASLFAGKAATGTAGQEERKRADKEEERLVA